MLVEKLLILLGLVSTASAQFGLTEDTRSFIVNAGSADSFVATIRKSDCDVRSLVYRGVEYQGPQAEGTHIDSGLGSAKVTAEIIQDKYIKVTCEAGTITQYIVAVSGNSNLYMATYITAQSQDELRYIARLDSSKLPSEYPFGEVSKTAGATATLEGSDVYLVNGQTRSKFYSSQRFIDDHVHCVYGANVHACFVKPQYETSAGGPFHRDINSNNGGAYTSLTYYMNSRHAKTEDYRMGLYGPYALTFTGSEIPRLSDSDFSFFSELNIKGYVPASGRGSVSGTASGISTGQGVVHWFNNNAQYWAYTSSGGAFTSPAMKPGTYTMKLYDTELEVASQSVSVSAGSTARSNIASTLSAPAKSLWRIGTCDGQPTGFRNAANQLRMHPSDSRMKPWGPLTFTVGTSTEADFPMALFKDVNTPQTINFDLAADQASGGATLRIRTTLAFAGGRPSLTVNKWAGRDPAAPTLIDSRGVTRGAYRGYGEAYEFQIPDGILVSGLNSIAISVLSGQSSNGFLSPNFILDCVELYR